MGDEGYGDLPRFTAQRRSGIRAEEAFGHWVGEQGHIWRPEHQEKDFGVDGEIELAGTTVSGLLVKAQVKGLASIRFREDGRAVIAVKRRTLNYWTHMRLPVVAILVDHTSKRMYWEAPPAAFAVATDELVFDQRHEITADPAAFFSALRDLAQHPPAIEELDRVPFFFKWLTEMEPIGDLDPGYRVGVVTDGMLGLFYEHVVRLAGLLRASDPLVPHTLWKQRDQQLTLYQGWDGDPDLMDVVAGEMLLYLRPIYRSLLARLELLAMADDEDDTYLEAYHWDVTNWFANTDLTVALPPRHLPDSAAVDHSMMIDAVDRPIALRFDAMLAAAGIARVPLRQIIADAEAQERRPRTSR